MVDYLTPAMQWLITCSRLRRALWARLGRRRYPSIEWRTPVHHLSNLSKEEYRVAVARPGINNGLVL